MSKWKDTSTAPKDGTVGLIPILSGLMGGFEEFKNKCELCDGKGFLND